MSEEDFELLPEEEKEEDEETRELLAADDQPSSSSSSSPSSSAAVTGEVASTWTSATTTTSTSSTTGKVYSSCEAKPDPELDKLLKIKLDLTNVPPELHNDLNHIADVLQQYIIECHKTQPTEFEPPPSYLEHLPSDISVISVKDLFQKPSVDDLEEIAVDPATNSLRKLPPDQLRQIQLYAEFRIPSANFRGQEHVWRLSRLLQKGAVPIENTKRKGLAVALEQLIVQLPRRIVNKPGVYRPCIIQGFKNIFWAVIRVPRYFIGFVELQPKYESHVVSAKIDKKRNKFVIATLQPTCLSGQQKDLSDYIEEITDEAKKNRSMVASIVNSRAYTSLHYPWKSNIDDILLDLRLYDPQTISKVKLILSDIMNTVDTKFQKERRTMKEEFLTEILSEKYYVNKTNSPQTDAPSVSTLYSSLSKSEKRAVQIEVEDRILLRKQRLFYELIESNSELAQKVRRKDLTGDSIKEHIGVRIVKHMKARVIVAQEEAKTALAQIQKSEEIRAELSRRYPIKSLVSSWLIDQTSKELEIWEKTQQWKTEQSIIERLKKENLEQEAYLFELHHKFTKEQAPQLIDKLQKELVPSRVFSWGRFLWRPKNWKIEKDSNGEYYIAEQCVTITSTSAVPFWRFINIFKRAYVWTSNGVFALSYFFINGPFGLRSLVLRDRFYPELTVNKQTGELIPDVTRPVETLTTRLKKLWDHVKESRRKFESQTDRGIIGKRISRVFNKVWNYFFKGFVGSVFILTFTPLFSLFLNFGVILPLLLMTPIWSIGLPVLKYLFDMIVFDLDNYGYSYRWFPFFNRLLKDIGVRGIGQIGVSLVGLVVHPLTSLVVSVATMTHYFLSKLYDKTMFYGIIKPLARIPAANTFLARRIAGPGLSTEFFYRVPQDLVLLAVQGRVESVAVTLYRAQMMKAITSPVTAAEQFHKTCLAPLWLNRIWNNLKSRSSRLQRKMEKAIEGRFSKSFIRSTIPSDVLIKMETVELADTIQKAEALIKRYVTTEVFKLQTPESFWEEYDLSIDNWTGLTEKLLKEIFGPSFLDPFEQTDKDFCLQVHHINLHKYGKMLIDNLPRDDLDKVTPVLSLDLETVSPTVRVATVDDVDPSGGLYSYLDINQIVDLYLKPKANQIIQKIFDSFPKAVRKLYNNEDTSEITPIKVELVGSNQSRRRHLRTGSR